MNPPDSELLTGSPLDEVPELEPDDTCNARLADHDRKFTGYCDNPAGEGTSHEGEGRCIGCGGYDDYEMTEAGRIQMAENRTEHGMTADPSDYHKTLDTPEERRFVIDVSRAIEKRISDNTGEIDLLDEVMARRVAVMLHIACKASGYFEEEGLFERIRTDDGTIEVPNRMLEEIRQYNKDIARILDDIGATKQSDAGEIDALAVWRSELS